MKPPKYAMKKKNSTPFLLASHLFQHVLDTKVSRYRGQWYQWTGQQWVHVVTDHMRLMVYQYLCDVGVEIMACDSDDVVGWKDMGTGRRLVDDLLDGLCALAFLYDETTPFWRNHCREEPAADRLLACTNGLLNLDTKELIDSTPDLFNLASVPFDYDANAPNPERWHRFLHELWPDDPESIALLQQWLGYLLSGSTARHKILALIGPRRSGKGTIARLIRHLMGERNVGAPTLASFGQNFGLAALANKSVGIIADARLRRTAPAVVERLLAISGGDAIDFDRKYQEAATGTIFPTRLMLLSNEIPVMPDASGALASRFMVLRTVKSFYGKEDLDLDAKLAAELPAILNWSLEGLEALQTRGCFTQPDTAVDTVEALEESASPVAMFVEQWCNVGPELVVNADSLYGCWVDWAKENGYHPGNAAQFGRDLRAVLPTLRKDRPRGGPGSGPGKRIYRYHGLRYKYRFEVLTDPDGPGGLGGPGDNTSIAHEKEEAKEKENNNRVVHETSRTSSDLAGIPDHLWTEPPLRLAGGGAA